MRRSDTDFGVVIGTYRRDYFMARACCASVRYFMPEVPICLLVDGAEGDPPTEDLEKAYGVQTLYRTQLRDPFLRRISTGYGWPKLALLWEAPFERFLFLDADTIMWGDLSGKLALDEPWDLRFDEHSHYKPEEATVSQPWPPTTDDSDEVLKDYVGQWFFDTDAIEAVFPDFPWRRYVDHYFTTGIWGARRGVFELDEYKRLWEIKDAHPYLFKFGEQGFLNFLFIRAEYQGHLRVTRVPWQAESSRITLAAKDARFRLGDDGLPIRDNGAWVIHYTDYKPLLPHKVSGRAMNYFRRRARREVFGQTGIAAEIALNREDYEYAGWKFYARRLIGKIKTL